MEMESRNRIMVIRRDLVAVCSVGVAFSSCFRMMSLKTLWLLADGTESHVILQLPAVTS